MGHPRARGPLTRAAIALWLACGVAYGGQAGAPRTDPNSRIAHEQLLAKARSGRIDVYFAGDSITRRWGATDYPQFLAHWRRTFFGWNAGNFGWGGDTAANVLWRLENGELDGVNPRVIVLLAGTNDIAGKATAGDVSSRLGAILGVMRQKAPAATVILTAIFPRTDRPELSVVIDEANRRIAALADGRAVRFLDVNARMRGTMPDGLHPSIDGYQVWADGLTPILTELLGPRAKEDQAPPPTGDPSAAAR